MPTMNPHPAITADQRAGLLRFATRASVAVALILIIAKTTAWLMTGSVTLLASLVDSTMDALASVINLLAVRYALQPADAEHRFGYGKAEALAALGQAAFITGSAMFLILEAINRLWKPEPLMRLDTGIAVTLFAIVATLALLAVQRHVIQRTGSTAIRADALHYATDLATNTATLAALGLSLMGWHLADPLFALLIAGYILYSAFGIAREAIDLLMDRELSPEIRKRIVAIAYAEPEVRGVHDLRTRQSGHAYFIQLHLEIDGDLSLRDSHAIADRVELAIAEAYPTAEVIVHQDPERPTLPEGTVREPRPELQ